MMPLTIQQLVEAIPGSLLLQCGDKSIVRGIATNHTKVKPGDVFVAFVGKHHDGHLYVEEAMRSGAVAALVTKEVPKSDSGGAIVRVADPIVAVGQLAARERALFNGPVIGVTGSNGKTTMKNMLSHVLQAGGPCLATEGNQNQELGLPLTLLRRREEDRTIVLEMGMRGRGQIAYLCEIAKPTVAVITNIGHSHIELLGSQEQIAFAKAELLESLPMNGFGVLCSEDEWLRVVADRCPGSVLWYGADEGKDAFASNIVTHTEGSSFTAHVLGHSARVELPIHGRHNITNALGALLVGAAHGLSLHAMVDRLATLPAAQGRLQLRDGLVGRKVIDDCYNASPLSVKASIQVLVDLAEEKPTVAILGDMFELGHYSEEGHREVGRFVAEQGVDYLIAIGEMAQWIAQEAVVAGCGQVVHFQQKEEALREIDHVIPEWATVLVKASRGMQLEDVVEKLCRRE